MFMPLIISPIVKALFRFLSRKEITDFSSSGKTRPDSNSSLLIGHSPFS
jgi:hypothetical protein